MNANQKNWRVLASAAAVGAMSGLAWAQTPCPAPDNCITNPGFEDVNVFGAVVGWGDLSGPAVSLRRTLTDGLGPVFVRSGQASWELRAPGSATEFRGFTTDVRNFQVPMFPYYDPAYDWTSQADVRISCWYYIPSSDPLVGQAFGIKMDIKSGLDAPVANFNQNWDYGVGDAWNRGEVVSGHTNDQWMYYEWTMPYADMVASVEAVANDGFVPYPQYLPGRIKVTAARWSGTPGTTTGSIFIDDLSITYVIPSTCAACPADYNQDGGVDGADLSAFFTDYEAGELECADTNFDGGIDGADLAAFFTAYEAGGC